MNFLTLKNELTTDPLARGYAAMTDSQAAADLNTQYRNGPADSLTLLKYLLVNKFRGATLYGRIHVVANLSSVRAGNVWAIPTVPFGTGGAEIAVTVDHIGSAASMIRIVNAGESLSLNMLDASLSVILDDLALGSGCHAIGGSDKTAIQALSTGSRTRADEIGLFGVTQADVQNARLI